MTNWRFEEWFYFVLFALCPLIATITGCIYLIIRALR